MSALALIFIIIAAVIAAGIIFSYFFMRYVAWRVYMGTLVRTSPEVWGRACSEPENEEQLAMWERGLAWAASRGVDTEATANGELKKKAEYEDIEIENEGFRLFGQYISRGRDRAVIIIPGRCESLMYSYYFAPPYDAAGYNILVVDIRCHGLSDGKYEHVGIGEDSDILKWAGILKEKYGNKSVLLHGICMGANTAVLAGASGSGLIDGLVLEGPYTSFRENYRQHLVVGKHPVWPLLGMVMNLIRKHTGIDVDKANPIDFIDKINIPTLILAGKNDLYSVPGETDRLFEKCAGEPKELIWFGKGSHSHLRIADEEFYDDALTRWLRKR